MRKLLMAVALAVAPLTACQTVPTSPAEIAADAIIDEQTVIGAQLTYKSWRLGLEAAVQAGLVKGDAARRARELDLKFYTALQATERAYEARNATSFAAAITEFHKIHDLTNQVLGR